VGTKHLSVGCLFLVVGLGVVGLGACGDAEDDTESPAQSRGAPSVASDAVATTPDLAEGVYRTDPLTAEDLRAAAAAAGFSHADVEPFATSFEESVVYELALANGSWIESEILDDGAPEVGWHGTYKVTDAGTVVATDPCGDITYAYAVAGSTLTLDVLEDECQDPVDLIAQTVIFESGPFTRQPDAAEAGGETPGVVVHEAASFVVPFTITLADWLDPDPAEDSSNFVTWEGREQDRGLRVLSPLEVYKPGQSEAVPPPKDYPTYLMSLADSGAEISDAADIEVDGRPATVVTIGLLPDAPPGSLDGALGCQEAGLAAEDCFGPQSDLLLRLAVIDVDGTPVLVWVRDFREAADTIEYESFDAMIASLRFS
jgi:hypothetical protein